MSRQINRLKLENQTLLDKINALKLQDDLNKGELKRTKEKLECLKLLVKRSWSGDLNAVIHVSRIVGVAPPSFEDNGNETVLAIPKSRALNNWMSLTLQLLAKVNKQRDDVIYVQRREYLMGRESLLDPHLDGYVNEERFNAEKDLDVLLSLNQNKETNMFQETDMSKETDTFQPCHVEHRRPRSCRSLRPSSVRKKNSKNEQTLVMPCNSATDVTKQALVIESVTLVEDKEQNRRRSSRIERNNESKDLSSKKISGKGYKDHQMLRQQSGRPKSAYDVKRKICTSIPRQKSTGLVQDQQLKKKSKRRPFSATPARVAYGPLDWVPSKNHYAYSSKDTLDVVEEKLRQTTKLLQKKLSINPLNFVD